jgi:predicted dehydrogenase
MTFPSSLPTARVPDPLQAPTLRWGILGPGWIAERFVPSLLENTRQEIVAVGGARTEQKAQAFAERFAIPRAYPGTAELVGDPDVDAVYVATPHQHHFPCALAAIEAGKHVLVEKPLALNAAEAQRLAEAALHQSVVLMEAYWTDFLPKFDVLRQLLADGALGEIHTILADHGERFGPEHRIMRADMAGGPLLDLGTYPVAFATKILGPPARVLASGQPAPSGVHGQASILLAHADGAQSVLHTTLFSHTPCQAVVAGSRATLTIPGSFYAPGDFTLTANDNVTRLQHREEPTRYRQLFHEAIHFAYCVGRGSTESPVRPLLDSITTLETLDEVRRQLGIVFDEERADHRRAASTTDRSA